MPTRKTTDALEIVDREFFRGKPAMQTLLADAREGAEVALALYRMRERAGLSQRELARRAGTTASVICRLENADYEGHSLALLRRIADALDYRVELRFRHGRFRARSHAASDRAGRSAL